MALVAVLGLSAVASPLLTVRALWLRSWVMMWGAALTSLIVGGVTIFSIGGLVFLLTTLQAAATFGLRYGATRWAFLALLLLATLLWVVIVPVQFLGFWFGGFGILGVVDMIALVLLLLPLNSAASKFATRQCGACRSGGYGLGSGRR